MMKIIENTVNPGYIPVQKVSVDKNEKGIFVPFDAERYSTGIIIAGENEGKMCRFIKHSGIEMEDGISMVPRIDIICLVEPEEGDCIVPYKGTSIKKGNDDDWITMQSTVGNGKGSILS